MPRTLQLATIALIALAVAVPSAPAKTRKPLQIGIADQQASTFSDPLFGALGVRYARINLAWDALEYDWQVGPLDAWMAAAQAAGVQPLVIFSQSRVKGRTRLLPTSAQFAGVVDQLRARYPFVRDFAAWNEANHAGQPTYRNPNAVAGYYKILRSKCRGCNVLPASLLDNPNILAWTSKLRKAIRRLRQPEPRIWGLHNYSDVNKLRDRSTRRLLKAVKGKVWVTESGGVVRATSPTASKFPQGASYAGRVASYIVGTMAKRNPRIQRVYFYNWRADAGPVSWDSGLIAEDGTARPAYDVLHRYLLKVGLARR